LGNAQRPSAAPCRRPDRVRLEAALLPDQAGEKLKRQTMRLGRRFEEQTYGLESRWCGACFRLCLTTQWRLVAASGLARLRLRRVRGLVAPILWISVLRMRERSGGPAGDGKRKQVLHRPRFAPAHPTRISRILVEDNKAGTHLQLWAAGRPRKPRQGAFEPVPGDGIVRRLPFFNRSLKSND